MNCVAALCKVACQHMIYGNLCVCMCVCGTGHYDLARYHFDFCLSACCSNGIQFNIARDPESILSAIICLPEVW